MYFYIILIIVIILLYEFTQLPKREGFYYSNNTCVNENTPYIKFDNTYVCFNKDDYLEDSIYAFYGKNKDCYIDPKNKKMLFYDSEGNLTDTISTITKKICKPYKVLLNTLKNTFNNTTTGNDNNFTSETEYSNVSNYSSISSETEYPNTRNYSSIPSKTEYSNVSNYSSISSETKSPYTSNYSSISSETISLLDYIDTVDGYIYSVRLLNPRYTGPVFHIYLNPTKRSDFYTDLYQTFLTTGPNNTGQSYASWYGSSNETASIICVYNQKSSNNYKINTFNSDNTSNVTDNLTSSITSFNNNHNVPKLILYNTKYVMSFDPELIQSFYIPNNGIAPLTVLSSFNNKKQNEGTILSTTTSFPRNPYRLGFGSDGISINGYKDPTYNYIYQNRTKNGLIYSNGIDLSKTNILSGINKWQSLGVSFSSVLVTQKFNIVGKSIVYGTSFKNFGTSENRGIDGYMSDICMFNVQLLSNHLKEYYDYSLFK